MDDDICISRPVLQILRDWANWMSSSSGVIPTGWDELAMAVEEADKLLQETVNV